MNNLKVIRNILLVIAGIFLVSFAYAGGCCFDRSTGDCSKNAEQDSCSAGDWSTDSTCNSVSECQAGCCVLGNKVEFITPSTCYFKAQAQGIRENFQAINEAQCSKLQSKQKEGACIVTGRYDDKTCKYTVQSSCTVGQFFEGTLCSDAIIKEKFNVTCTKTKNTMCYNEDAHYVDSCGNPDKKETDCDYENGTICSMEKAGASCKSLDCVDDKGVKRKNGEAWCYYDGVKLNYFSLDGASRDTKYGVSEKIENWVEEKVGSEFYRKFCLNGEIQVEPCAGMRNEACDMGKCVKNPWQDCLLAGNSTKDCDTKWCSIFNGHPGCGISLGDVEAASGGYVPAGVAFCKGADNKGYTDIDSLNKFVEGSDVKLTTTWDPVTNSQVVSGMPTEFRPKIREEAVEAAGIKTCFPLIAGGFMYEKQIGDTSDSTVCSAGNVQEFQADFVRSKHDSSADTFEYEGVTKDFKHTKYFIAGIGDVSWGLAGIFNMNPGWWGSISQNNWGTDTTYKIFTLGKDAKGDYMYETPKELEPWFVDSMQRRCLYTSDCVGQTNYLGSGGTGTNIITNPVSGVLGTGYDGRVTVTHKISLQCMPYEAPKEGNCGKCQTDPKYPCTEYKCKSIGSNCEFIDDLGINKAVCMPSSDLSAPKILSHNLNPASPITPFSSVTINLTTDEASSCKFSLGKAGSKFEDMTFAFGNDWGKNHSLILNIPGKVKANVSDEEVQYDFLSRDGKYEMYVRCSDPKGNWNIEPYLIKFEVMQTPDGVPPALMYFNPKSGSPIAFNTTTKSIKFKIHEPAECKWDFTDKNFSEMANNFSCDLSVYSGGVLNGYNCDGVLTNVSTGIGKETKFNIRCKDQPGLEGNESKFYKRNVNEKSTPYSLKNSDKLEIIEVAPKGRQVFGVGTNNFTLLVRTKGGGDGGKAVCKWKLDYLNVSTQLRNLSTTNSTLHKQVVSNKTEGDYSIYVECSDIAGNIANATESLALRYDRDAPIISRVYDNKGSLRVYTSEWAVCKYASVLDASIGCSFSLANTNLTSMTSTNNLEHSGVWTKGRTYYIKCQDLYGNINSVCGVIGKAV